MVEGRELMEALGAGLAAAGDPQLGAQILANIERRREKTSAKDRENAIVQGRRFGMLGEQLPANLAADPAAQLAYMEGQGQRQAGQRELRESFRSETKALRDNLAEAVANQDAGAVSRIRAAFVSAVDGRASESAPIYGEGVNDIKNEYLGDALPEVDRASAEIVQGRVITLLAKRGPLTPEEEKEVAMGRAFVGTYPYMASKVSEMERQRGEEVATVRGSVSSIDPTLIADEEAARKITALQQRIQKDADSPGSDRTLGGDLLGLGNEPETWKAQEQTGRERQKTQAEIRKSVGGFTGPLVFSGNLELADEINGVTSGAVSTEDAANRLDQWARDGGLKVISRIVALDSNTLGAWARVEGGGLVTQIAATTLLERTNDPDPVRSGEAQAAELRHGPGVVEINPHQFTVLATEWEALRGRGKKIPLDRVSGLGALAPMLDTKTTQGVVRGEINALSAKQASVAESASLALVSKNFQEATRLTTEATRLASEIAVLEQGITTSSSLPVGDLVQTAAAATGMKRNDAVEAVKEALTELGIAEQVLTTIPLPENWDSLGVESRFYHVKVAIRARLGDVAGAQGNQTGATVDRQILDNAFNAFFETSRAYGHSISGIADGGSREAVDGAFELGFVGANDRGVPEGEYALFAGLMMAAEQSTRLTPTATMRDLSGGSRADDLAAPRASATPTQAETREQFPPAGPKLTPEEERRQNELLKKSIRMGSRIL